MTDKGDAGLEMAISSNAKEIIKQKTGVDPAFVQDPQRFLSLAQFKERTKRKLEQARDNLAKLDKAIGRAQGKRKEYLEEVMILEGALQEIQRMEKNRLLSDYLAFRDRLKHDISKIGVETGHMEKKVSTLEQVMG